MAEKKDWSKDVKLKPGALGPLSSITLEEMLRNPKTVRRVNVLANLGNVKAKKLMASYRAAKKGKK
jgi:hypothetical protein